MLEIITAEDMRTIATDITNVEIAECIKHTIFEQILPIARKGGLSTVVSVRNNRPKEFYNLFSDTMTVLGYKVSPHENTFSSSIRKYTIRW